MAIQTGARLGGYEILALLGVGGMGEVYQARDMKLGRDVAVKVLRSDVANDAQRLARFEREARLLASLNHPHIAALLGMEENDGRPFLVMELAPGPTLAERLADGPLSLAETLALGGQIAEALQAAHDQGIIHRDLKPGNIKITPGGKVKLLDFGLAKALVGDTDGIVETASFQTTRAGAILGTPCYMSPEQVRGQAADRRADIWAFGCVLFEALTARQAFTGKTGADTFAAILEREPDWSLLPATTPPGLQRLSMRCLRKDAARRPRDIGDVRIELLDLAEPAPISVRDSKPVAASSVTAVSSPTATLSSLELEQVQKDISLIRLNHLHRMQKRAWIHQCCSVLFGLGLGTFTGLLVEAGSRHTPAFMVPTSSVSSITAGAIAGLISAVLGTVGVWLCFTRLIRIQVKRIVKNHPAEVESWGGEPTLHDPLAVEGLLRWVRGRE